MNTCEFSEFQFSYSIVREIEDRYFTFTNCQISLMPEWINQIVEGRKGYDVAFKPIYLQFKLPQYITSAHGKDWNAYSKTPYYQFYLRNRQHNILMNLSRVKGNSVFYCSPSFVTYDEYRRYHTNHEVAENSMFVNCSSLIDIKDNRIHRITYLDPIVYQHSQIKKGEGGKGSSKLFEEIAKVESYMTVQSFISDNLEVIRRRKKPKDASEYTEADVPDALARINEYLDKCGIVSFVLTY